MIWRKKVNRVEWKGYEMSFFDIWQMKLNFIDKVEFDLEMFVEASFVLVAEEGSAEL